MKRPTDNVEAYNLYLKGRHYHSRFTEASLEKGLGCFAEALALEPMCAQTLVSLTLSWLGQRWVTRHLTR